VNGRGGLPITGWLALLIALAGLLAWKQAPLDPRRTAATDDSRVSGVRLQDINARLWEDPFAAVARAKPDTADPSHSLATVCEHLQARAGTRPSRLLLLAVMVSGAPYADGEERRRRTRYAVQSALALGHYVPENADALGYFQWTRGLTVPFEVLRRKNASRIGASQFALVAWVTDESLALLEAGDAAVQSTEGRPIANLMQLREQVRAGCASSGPFAAPDSFEFKVIGPASSQSLRTMAQEAMRMKPPDACPACPPVMEIYSPAATAPAKEMLSSTVAAGDADDGCAAAADVWYCRLGQMFWRQARVRFFRATASDDALARTLLDELDRREVRVEHAGPAERSPHHVALVSEWDTYYGRRLPAVILRSARLEAACETDPSELADNGGPLPECRVHRFSYLRGLDGEGPRPARPETTSGEKSAGHGIFSAGQTDPADGPRQFDYLRRLAGQIESQNARLQARGEGEIGAIGVLGSDLHDKLAVLRALRPVFPRAVFFTTDLDARLLAAEHLEWTRNLIVASGFGLQLAACLQKDVPPFRGTYQTATFFGTRVALFNAFGRLDPFRADRCPDRADHAPGAAAGRSSTAAAAATLAGVGEVEPRQLDQWLAKPRLFELGRTRAVDLSPAGGPCDGLAACEDIHPPGFLPSDGLRQFALGAPFLLALLPLALLGRGVREVLLRPLHVFRLAWRSGDAGSRWRAGAIAGLCAVLLLWPVWRMARGMADPRGEPFLWLEGVSVWPSNLLRLVALALGMIFLCYTLSEVGRQRDILSAAFRIPHGTDGRRLLERLWRRFTLSRPAKSETPIMQLWAQFDGSGHWSLVLGRACLWTVVFVAVGYGFFIVGGEPARPARGADAFAIERILVTAGVMLFLLVLFAVNDVIRLSGRLFSAVCEVRVGSDWPKATLQAEARALGVDPKVDARVRAAVLDPWLDVQWVARLSESVAPLTLLPFILLALLVVARWPLIDRWDVPLSLGAALAASFVIACVNAWLMQRAASRARRTAVARLEALLLESRGGAGTGYPAIPHLEALIRAIQTLRRGAFVPFVEQPIVRAVLLPFSSAGSLYLIDLFALAG
jgi:hypothetical protein